MSGRPDIAPSGFFSLRTPLLAFDVFETWGDGLELGDAHGTGADVERAVANDRAVLRQRLRAIVHRPDVREALFVASPSLSERVQTWLDNPTSESGRKVERALVAYFTRMTSRPTPFGLFAGCSVGTIGDTAEETTLDLVDEARYERHSRLDMDYLWALAEALSQDRPSRSAFVLRPNGSLYSSGGRLRYAEGFMQEGVRAYRLVAIEETDYLLATIERAIPGASLTALTEELVDDEVTAEEAEEFVHDLIDAQVLVPDVYPPVTGPEPVPVLVEELGRHAVTAGVAAHLDDARKLLEEIDAAGVGCPTDAYARLAAALDDLPAKPDLSRLVQVDLVKPVTRAVLGRDVLREIVAAVEVLHCMAPRKGQDELATFRDEFVARYSDREVPLVEALDDENGIGFGPARGAGTDSSPLLEGLAFPGAPAEGGDQLVWGWREQRLLRRLTEVLQQGDGELVLGPDDLPPGEPEPLPDAFDVLATVAGQGPDLRVLLEGASGPSGIRLLGRFCHGDPLLDEQVRGHLRAEEALAPGRVFAEIVHLPGGRVGNILCRPVLRSYEIAYLGRSGAPADHRLPVTDLLLSVREGRLVLRSASRGFEIVARLSTAHDHTSFRNLGVYRFLGALQYQDVGIGLQWYWGPFAGLPTLPRVVFGRAVIARAQWNVDEAELRGLADEAGHVHYEVLDTWRRRCRLPRHVALVEGDNELVVDLDNVLSVECFLSTARQGAGAKLVEMFPGPDALVATGPEGRFVHQMVVPFVRTTPAAPTARRVASPRAASAFAPGSEWLYTKLYCGPATADVVLNEVVAPLVRDALTPDAQGHGAAVGWFFIRYLDPHPHIRLRFQGAPQGMAETVLPMLHRAVEPLLHDGRLWRVQIDTYEPEVARYGGDKGMLVAERIFQADSDTVLGILGLLQGDAGLDARWRLALLGVDALLDDFGLDQQARLAWAQQWRDMYLAEHDDDRWLKKSLGDRFRREREWVAAALSGESTLPAVDRLSRRSERIAPLVSELRDLERAGALTVPVHELIGNYTHMFVNRILRSAQREQELAICDFLARHYRSAVARS